MKETMQNPPKTDRPRIATPDTGMSLRVLFADDEPHLQQLIAAELPRMGHQVTVCPDGTHAIRELENDNFDCLLVDLDMPGTGGIEVIEAAKRLSPETEAVVLTGKGSTETAISALRLGAFDYLQKPCKLVELKSIFQRVAVRRQLNHKISSLQRRLERVEGSSEMIGQHRSMQRVKAMIEKVGPTESTVMIRGATGTGKELAARAVHQNSLRHDQPFVAINCGALPENLIESELFGHRKGAFTGADEHRKGLFEVADGGTLFMDEVAELPKAMQATLLRVLENGEVRRVGDNSPFQVDVRIVCATHRDLASMVAAGEFREDLMYRINTFEIQLPTLHDRVEDIPLLARHLLARHLPQAAHVATPFTNEAVAMLKSHDWPGNIRELANVIEHASILSQQLPIGVDDLPTHLGKQTLKFSAAKNVGKSLREIEMETIYATLDQLNGNKTATAQQLGISLKTLYNKLNSELSRRAG